MKYFCEKNDYFSKQNTKEIVKESNKVIKAINSFEESLGDKRYRNSQAQAKVIGHVGK